MSLEKPLNIKKWESLVDFISVKFGSGHTLDIQAILFLIGINELGQGYRNFTQEEKTNLLHIAICKLLERYGYYIFLKRDQDGWPHWDTNQDISQPSPKEQTELLKKSAILYFEESGIDY